MRHPVLAPTALALAASLISACGGSSGGSSSGVTLDLDNVRQVLETNADIALAGYNDALDTAVALQAALTTFREDPTELNFVAAKQAWLVAREPYGQTEVFRFRNSPIDSTDYSSEDGPEGDINAWPLGEALIDYVITGGDFGDSEIGVTSSSTAVNGGGSISATGYDNSENIIGRTDITINAALLANTATASDEHDVISGYHAIEFLLWGQDLNDSAGVTNGTDRADAIKSEGASNYAAGGDRPLSDFQDSADSDTGYNETDDLYDSTSLSDRRHKYLEVAVQKLIDDLAQVRDGWVDGVLSNYRDQFTTVDTQAEARQKLAEILTGMGTLSEGELAGERMQIAFSTNSQEDEHSCFSDNTHRDIWLNAEGVRNLYYGEYAGYDSTLDGTDNEVTRAVDGYGIRDLLLSMGESAVVAQVDAALDETEDGYEAVDALARANQPVDVQIQNPDNMDAMYDTIIALNAQSALIQTAADRLGINDDVADDDASECDTSDPLANCG